MAEILSELVKEGKAKDPKIGQFIDEAMTAIKLDAVIRKNLELLGYGEKPW